MRDETNPDDVREERQRKGRRRRCKITSDTREGAREKNAHERRTNEK